MRLSPTRFNAQLGVMGQKVTWAQARACPNTDPDTGAPVLGCPNCRGLGFTWAPPVAAWTGLAGMKVVREFAALGLWQSGDVVFSIPSDSPLYGAGEKDRVLMTQSSQPFSKQLTRDGTDLLNIAVVNISAVYWLDPTSQAQTFGAIPTVGAGGVLTWAAGAAAPPADVQYIVQGRRRPEYFLFQDLPQDRAHFGGLALPRRVQARLFDLFNRGTAGASV